MNKLSYLHDNSYKYLKYITRLPNIDIWRFSPPKDLTCKNLFYNSIHQLCIQALTTTANTDVGGGKNRKELY